METNNNLHTSDFVIMRYNTVYNLCAVLEVIVKNRKISKIKFAFAS